MFKLALSSTAPTSGGSNAQRGYPAPGAGAQVTGPYVPAPAQVVWGSDRPTKGARTFFKPVTGEGAQRGFPSPFSKAQRRPAGSTVTPPLAPATAIMVETPYYDRGAAAFVPNFGKILQNPIGAGINVPYRPQSSYGGTAQYVNGSLWWTSQAVPTTIPLQGLSDPQSLADLLGMVNVQAVVRTTG